MLLVQKTQLLKTYSYHILNKKIDDTKGERTVGVSEVPLN